tara:strand:+ start:84 stop:227 length:144 start_codon:yes stop_codon:yes gene_type:complete
MARMPNPKADRKRMLIGYFNVRFTTGERLIDGLLGKCREWTEYQAEK